MTDKPTGFFWMDLFVRLTESQIDALLALMTDLRRLLETVATPDSESVILWLNSTYSEGSTALQKLPDALLKLREFANAHSGDPTGFSYGAPPPPTANWWDGKNPRFDCYAKAGCRIMKVPAQNGFTQAVGAEPVYRTMKGGEHMDCFEVWRPGGWPPDWMVVLKTEVYWLVCLASETTEQAP